MLSESRKQHGVGLPLTQDAAPVSRCLFDKRKEKRDTMRDCSFPAFSSKHPQPRPARSARTHARTLPIKRHKLMPAARRASCVNSSQPMGATILRAQWIHIQNYTSASVTQRTTIPFLEGNVRHSTPTPLNPHGLNLRADTGWSAARRESRQLSHSYVSFGAFPRPSSVRGELILRSTFGELEDKKVSSSVSLCKHKTSCAHGRTRRPKYT